MPDDKTPGATTQRVRAEVHAVITRADGTVQHLGVISATYRTPLRHLWWRYIGSRAADRRIRRANKHRRRG